MIHELPDFPSPFPDESDDVHVRFGVARHHPEQRALPDAGPSEYSDPLSGSERENAVDDLDAYGKGGRYHLAPQGVRRLGVQGVHVRGDDGPLVVHGLPESVEHAPEQGLSDPDAERAVHREDIASRPDILERPERHEKHPIAAESHDFRLERSRAVAETDAAEVADPNVRSLRFDDKPHYLNDPSVDPDELGLFEPASEDLDQREVSPGWIHTGFPR